MLHACIVEALEALAPGRLAEQVERLAHHALRGEVWDKAFTYCRQAGTKAYAGSAHREAVGYWEQALEALAHLPPDRPTLEQAADVHGNFYFALLSLTQYAQMLTHLRAAEALASGLTNHRRLGVIYRSLANTLRLMQDYEPALAYSQRAHAMATALGDVRLQMESRLPMGWTYCELGDYRQAMKHFRQALRSSKGRHAPSPAILPTAWASVLTTAWTTACSLRGPGWRRASVNWGPLPMGWPVVPRRSSWPRLSIVPTST